MTDNWTNPPGGAPQDPLRYSNMAMVAYPIYFHDSPIYAGLSRICLIARCPYYPTGFFSILSFYPHMFMVFILVSPPKKRKKHLLAIDSQFLVDIPLREIKPTSSLRATDPARCSLGFRWEVKSHSFVDSPWVGATTMCCNMLKLQILN